MDAEEAAVRVSTTPAKLHLHQSEPLPILEQNAEAMNAYAQWCVRFALSFAASSVTGPK
jgi:hypothetical protein